MTETFPTIREIDPHGGYVVRRPRSTDGIGLTLRIAFGGDQRLPGEITRCIEVLDRIPGRH